MFNLIKAKLLTTVKVYEVYGFAGVVRLLLRLNRGPAFISTFSESKTIDEIYDFIQPSISESNRSSLEALQDEYRLFKDQIKLNMYSRKYFTEAYDLGENLLFLLYTLIMRVGVERILESGVAAGKSTSFILNAQKSLGKGKLVSVDITNNVGDLIPENLLQDFNLIVLPQLNRRGRFSEIAIANRFFDVFVHDSDHSIQYQLFEIETVLELIESLRWLLIDDINQETYLMLKSHSRVREVFVIDEGHKFSSIALLNE